MTPEEASKAFADLKAQGTSDEDLINALGQMFQDGKITKDQLGELLNQMGYEFTDEFKGLSDEDSKANLWEKPDGGDGNPAPAPAPAEATSDPNAEAPEAEKPEDDGKGEDDEEEKKKAMALFGRDE